MKITKSRWQKIRKGFTLLEVLVAMTILALVGLSTLEAVQTAARLGGVAVMAERDLSEASQLLHSVSVWSRTELEQRLGTREQGEWSLEITRETPDFFLVVVRDRARGAKWLQTGIFCPRSSDVSCH